MSAQYSSYISQLFVCLREGWGRGEGEVRTDREGRFWEGLTRKRAVWGGNLLKFAPKKTGSPNFDQVERFKAKIERQREKTTETKIYVIETRCFMRW